MKTDASPSGPTIRRGHSKQDYGTPPEFIQAVEKRFGPLIYDLACTHENCKARNPVTFDSLGKGWAELQGNKWLNPPFANIRPWVKKACETSYAKDFCRAGPIFVLVPASVGSNWWRDYVHEECKVYFLNGRLTFEGQTQPFPKDCALLAYDGRMWYDGYRVWGWRKDMRI